MHIRPVFLTIVLSSSFLGLTSGGCDPADVGDTPAEQSSSTSSSSAGSGAGSGASSATSASSTGAGGASSGGDGGGTAGGPANLGGGGDGGGGSAELPEVSVYIAGDSTVQTYTNSPIHQAGWGQFLGEFFDARVHIENRAIGGRTARRFIDEGRLDDVLDDLQSGDYFLVQFGTNDSNRNATYEHDGATIPYYLDPATDFKSYLTQYIEGAQGRDAIPVLVTPPPRRSCTGDSHEFGNGLAAYAGAMRELGSALDVAVIDLNERTLARLRTIGCEAAGRDFFLVRADGSVDGTHFQETGAHFMAGFVADGAADAGLLLGQYRE
ncbi:lysophospholipase L1 and related esterase/ rhamnogalacturonan acetylesterase [Sorangium cellulosum]|uniref:Lysophospholipase L1 and related esterase/ rhamnogalacturonan acetylesterase n=1 Tax=Sorangium cellulosum TaxID=56 RepID=A0A2L0F0N2_SORCE|nr:rhamnogalacturonan acetylesterase [Sorangium cellulosum]AUX45127.1 lysophospholipase L1 and related esterase/ rhamnogalacturonan acetylesterase [Sorangium cellulosum]